MGENVDFGIRINSLFQLGSGWLTSRLYSQFYWNTFWTFGSWDPKVLSLKSIVKHNLKYSTSKSLVVSKCYKKFPFILMYHDCNSIDEPLYDETKLTWDVITFKIVIFCYFNISKDIYIKTSMVTFCGRLIGKSDCYRFVTVRCFNNSRSLPESRFDSIRITRLFGWRTVYRCTIHTKSIFKFIFCFILCYRALIALYNM